MTLLVRLTTGRVFHTHRPETVARLRSRRLACVSSVTEIPNCQPSICETCKAHDAALLAAVPFLLVSQAAQRAAALGATSTTVGPSSVSVRRHAQ